MSSPIRAHHLPVTRTARYWMHGDPASAKDVWVVLHGYKQLARRFLNRFAPIAAPGRLVVAPEALSRFYIEAEPGRHGPSSVVGATWMTREDREVEIRDYVGYLDALVDELETSAPDAHTLTVLGFSQGVATATRWATQGAVTPSRLVLWGDFTPPDLDLNRAREALTDVDVVMVRGSDDRALSPRLAEEEATRLAGAGISYRTLTYPGGHDIHADTLSGLASAYGA